jgi:hypothetical protein
MIGLSVYLSYSYTRSGIGRQLGRPKLTPGWLALVGLGSLLAAIGILTVPHDASLAEDIAKIKGGFAEGARTIIAFGCIGVGLLFGAVGAIMGAGASSTKSP